MRRISDRAIELVNIVRPYMYFDGTELKIRDDAPPEVKTAYEEILLLEY